MLLSVARKQHRGTDAGIQSGRYRWSISIEHDLLLFHMVHEVISFNSSMIPLL